MRKQYIRKLKLRRWVKITIAITIGGILAISFINYADMRMTKLNHVYVEINN